MNLSPAEIDPDVSPIRPVQNKPNQLNENTGLLTTTATHAPLLTQEIQDQVDVVNGNEQTGDATQPTNVDDQKPIDKFCKCTEIACNCCRDLSLPFLPVRGPGCARIQYLGDEKMAVQIKYGDIVLASRTINGKKAAPICVGLPGGYNRFCARFYSLAKEKAGFKSCMSLELRAEDDIEAQLRVSCFKLGRKGFTVTEAEPIPTPIKDKDDEDDDLFAFVGGESDDDDEDDDDDAADDDGDGLTADDDTDYDFRFIEEIFGSESDTDDESNATAIDATNEPQTKESTPANDELKTQFTNKKKTKKNDSLDMTDLIFGVFNLF